MGAAAQFGGANNLISFLKTILNGKTITNLGLLNRFVVFYLLILFDLFGRANSLIFNNL